MQTQITSWDLLDVCVCVCVCVIKRHSEHTRDLGKFSKWVCCAFFYMYFMYFMCSQWKVITVCFCLFPCSIQAGCQALPPLLSIRQVMMQRQVAGVWSNKDELPVSLPACQAGRLLACLFGCLSVHLHVCLSDSLFACLSTYLSVLQCLSDSLFA